MLDDDPPPISAWAHFSTMPKASFREKELDLEFYEYSFAKYAVRTAEGWRDWKLKLERYASYLRNCPLEKFHTTIGRGHSLETPKSWLEHMAEPAPLVAEEVLKMSSHQSNPTDILKSGLSPFERFSPRYHLSTSPGWYRRDISPRNPLYHLSPLQRSTLRQLPHRNINCLRTLQTIGWDLIVLEMIEASDEASFMKWITNRLSASAFLICPLTGLQCLMKMPYRFE